MTIEFDWDDQKAKRNFAKHGVTFTAAKDAVLDPDRIEKLDDRFDYGEERLQIIGVSLEAILFVITVSYSEDHCRIISARRANRAEKALYRGNL